MESDELDILMEEWQEYERNRLGNEFKYFINDGFIDKKIGRASCRERV